MGAQIPLEQAHKLVEEAIAQLDKAYCPYSRFPVGAALLTADGRIIGGCNVENASYGGTICAERTACCRAVAEGNLPIVAVAVASSLPTPSVSPCGICRQFLREFLPLQAPIWMVGSKFPKSQEEGIRAIREQEKDTVLQMTLSDLLPMSFGPEQLDQAPGRQGIASVA